VLQQCSVSLDIWSQKLHTPPTLPVVRSPLLFLLVRVFSIRVNNNCLQKAVGTLSSLYICETVLFLRLRLTGDALCVELVDAPCLVCNICFLALFDVAGNPRLIIAISYTLVPTCNYHSASCCHTLGTSICSFHSLETHRQFKIAVTSRYRQIAAIAGAGRDCSIAAPSHHKLSLFLLVGTLLWEATVSSPPLPLVQSIVFASRVRILHELGLCPLYP
jgi:hypothetical protein